MQHVLAFLGEICVQKKLFSLRASRRGHAVVVAHAFLRLVYMLSIWLSVYAVWEDDATQLFRI